MSEYIVFRPSGSIGIDFNEAADVLNKNKDVVVKDTIRSSPFSGFLIETNEKGIDALQKQLGGWSIFPNGPVVGV